jgi:hypothetical protein
VVIATQIHRTTDSADVAEDYAEKKAASNGAAFFAPLPPAFRPRVSRASPSTSLVAVRLSTDATLPHCVLIDPAVAGKNDMQAPVMHPRPPQNADAVRYLRRGDYLHVVSRRTQATWHITFT